VKKGFDTQAYIDKEYNEKQQQLQYEFLTNVAIIAAVAVVGGVIAYAVLSPKGPLVTYLGR